MKKLLSVMLLAAVLIFVGNNQAEAREVYVGSYSDGSSVYLLTESVSKSPGGVSGGNVYNCRVRAGRDYLSYEFWLGRTGSRTVDWAYKNSEGYSGLAYDGSSPVAAAILNYLRNNF